MRSSCGKQVSGTDRSVQQDVLLPLSPPVIIPWYFKQIGSHSSENSSLAYLLAEGWFTVRSVYSLHSSAIFSLLLISCLPSRSFKSFFWLLFSIYFMPLWRQRPALQTSDVVCIYSWGMLKLLTWVVFLSGKSIKDDNAVALRDATIWSRGLEKNTVTCRDTFNLMWVCVFVFMSNSLQSSCRIKTKTRNHMCECMFHAGEWV